MGKIKVRNEDLIGKRYGRLVVDSYSHCKNNYHFFKCKCDCGNEKIALKSHIINGATSSCGCLHKETQAEKMRKRRIYYNLFGRQFTIEEIEKELGIHRITFYRRLKQGESVEDIYMYFKMKGDE